MSTVVATRTTMTTLPPPTINSLDAYQRARLVKSTRKLGHLLGATPHVLDPDLLLPVPPRGKRNRQVHLGYSSSAASSVLSFKDLEEYHETSVLIPTHPQISQTTTTERQYRQKTTHQARPLVLRLRTVPSLPAVKARAEAASPSTFTTTATNVDAEIPTPLPLPPPNSTPSPPSPLFTAELDDTMSSTKPDRDTILRKRMAKLTRTLGENIPPELLFSTSQLSRHKRSPSEPSLPRQWRKDRAEEPSKTTTSHSSPTYVPSDVYRSYSQPALSRRKGGKSASLDTETTRIISSKTPAEALSQATAEGSTSTVDLLTSLTPVRRRDDASNESCLDGEWSIKDAEKRAMALRKLRC